MDFFKAARNSRNFWSEVTNIDTTFLLSDSLNLVRIGIKIEKTLNISEAQYYEEFCIVYFQLDLISAYLN